MTRLLHISIDQMGIAFGGTKEHASVLLILSERGVLEWRS